MNAELEALRNAKAQEETQTVKDIAKPAVVSTTTSTTTAAAAAVASSAASTAPAAKTGGEKRKAFSLTGSKAEVRVENTVTQPAPAADEQERGGKVARATTKAASAPEAAKKRAATASASNGTSASAGSGAEASAAVPAAGGRAVVIPEIDTSRAHEHVPLATKGAPPGQRFRRLVDYIVERELGMLEQTCEPEEAFVVASLRRIMADFGTEVERLTIAREATRTEKRAPNPRTKELEARLAQNEAAIASMQSELAGWKSVGASVDSFGLAAREAAAREVAGARGLTAEQESLIAGLAPDASGFTPGKAPEEAGRLMLNVGRVLRVAREAKAAHAEADGFYGSVAQNFHARSFESYGPNISNAKSIISSLLLAQPAN